MRALYLSAATAVIGGLLMGAAIRPRDSDLQERPVGPQIIASNGWDEDTAATAPVYTRAGPVPEYVIGTDWARPQIEEVQVAAVYEPAYEPLSYAEPEIYVRPVSLAAAPAMATEAAPQPARRPVSYPSLDGDVLGSASSATDNTSDAVETLDDGGAERVEVIRFDGEGGRQINNLAHGADPHALVGEPAA